MSHYGTINLDGPFDLILIKDKNKDILYKPFTFRYKSNNTSVTYCKFIVSLGLLIFEREIVIEKKKSGIENYGQKIKDKRKEKKKEKKVKKERRERIL